MIYLVEYLVFMIAFKLRRLHVVEYVVFRMFKREGYPALVNDATEFLFYLKKDLVLCVDISVASQT